MPCSVVVFRLFTQGFGSLVTDTRYEYIYECVPCSIVVFRLFTQGFGSLVTKTLLHKGDKRVKVT